MVNRSAQGILNAHLSEGDYRRSALISVLGHLAVFVGLTFGVSLLPESDPIVIGLGEGGGQGGDFVSVGLAEDTGGGEGMYKPPVTPQPQSAPPEPKKVEAPKVEQPEPVVDENVFVEKQKSTRKAQPKSTKSDADPPSQKGLIPREPDPGKETGNRPSSGSGGGFGSGRGVLIGSGSGQDGTIDSWYIRQVEQRVGRNWLQTSLGSLSRRVKVVASFVVRADGRIDEITLIEGSGIRSVDLAVQRAIQASTPLPPLPYELRDRVVKFQAVFEYPPR